MNFTLTVVGAFGVDDFGGRVLRADETGELPLVGLVGPLRAGLALFADDVEEGPHRAVNAAFRLRNASGRTRELDPIVVEEDVQDVQIILTVPVVELAGPGRRRQRHLQLLHFPQQEFTELRCVHSAAAAAADISFRFFFVAT